METTIGDYKRIPLSLLRTRETCTEALRTLQPPDFDRVLLEMRGNGSFLGQGGLKN